MFPDLRAARTRHFWCGTQLPASLENLVVYSPFITVIGGCGTFFAITIASKAFKGIPVVKQHRLVNKALQKEIEGIHGLQVTHPLPLLSPLAH